MTAWPIENRQKIALLWAARRERIVAVRVSYEVSLDRGCRIYSLTSMEELGVLGAV